MSLKRVLGPVDAAWLVAGNMIGAGIFFMPGIVAGRLPGWIGPLLAWTLGGLLALCGAAVYAELGSRLPRAGGDYRYLATAFGPLWGFLTGWAGMLLTFSGAAAAMTTVAIQYLHAAVPGLPGTAAQSTLVAGPAIVLALTWANTAGARAGGRTTVWLTAIPLAGLIGLFGAGLAAGSADLRPPAAWVPPAGGWPLALAAALVPVYFTYSGWNAAAYLAGEVRDPARNLARGLLGGTAAVTLVYLLINAIFLAVIPADRLAGSTTAGAQAARILLGPVAERVLSALIAVAVLGSANVTLMAGARIYYAMARDGLAPSALGRTNAAGVPATALWASGVWTALLAATGRIEVLVNWATLAILLLSALAVASLFRLRRQGVGEAVYRCPGYPATPLIYLVASLAVASASAIQAPRQSLFGALIVLAGLPVYAFLRRGAARRGGVDP